MDLSESEKNLLTLIGEDSQLSRSQLQYKLEYKRASTVSIKMKDLRKADYIKGPYYHINFNAVGTNYTSNVFCEIRFDPNQYHTVLELVKCIDCWEWIFPTIQGDTLFAFFRSNYYTYLTRLLTILKNADLIEYQVHVSQNRWYVQNPTFSGRVFPQVADLFEDVVVDMGYPEKTHTTRWRFIDLKMMQYLQVRTCSISEIQRIEKKVYGRFWRRSDVKYSIEKIVSTGAAERKYYNISPYPRDECFAFLLLVEGDALDVLRFTVNFGKQCRIYKAYTMCRDKGFIWCWASPQIGPELMSVLDRLYPRIQVRCLQVKSAHHAMKKSFNDEHFDLEKQKWKFPFKKYKEEIESLLEKRKR